MHGVVTLVPGGQHVVSSYDELMSIVDDVANCVQSRRYVHAVFTICGVDEYAPSKILQLAERRGVNASVRYVDGCVLLVVDAIVVNFVKFVKELEGIAVGYRGEDKV